MTGWFQSLFWFSKNHAIKLLWYMSLKPALKVLYLKGKEGLFLGPQLKYKDYDITVEGRGPLVFQIFSIDS